MKRWQKISHHLLAILLILSLFTSPAASIVSASETTASPSELYMHVLDVGQGLSLLFESDGHYMLYDGGDREYSSKVVSYLKEQEVQTLDYIIVSHYDSDHLNGVVGALNVFDVQNVIAPDYTTDTRVFESFQSIIQEKEIDINQPVVGSEFALGSTEITILAPASAEYSDVNDYSVSIRLDCGENSFLVTGDATTLSEAEMLSSGQNLDCDMMMVGHHGSTSSTSEAFLQAVSPEAAIISCELSNQYQHPSQEVMELLKANEIPVFRTDMQGDLVIASNGTEFFYSEEPCNDYSYASETNSAENPDSQISESASTENPSSDYTGTTATRSDGQPETAAEYVLNTNSKKFHFPSCHSARRLRRKIMLFQQKQEMN